MARFGRSFPMRRRSNFVVQSLMILPFVTKTLGVVYNIRNLTEKSVTLIYTIFAGAAISKILKYSIQSGIVNSRMDWSQKSIDTMDWKAPDSSNPTEFTE